MKKGESKKTIYHANHLDLAPKSGNVSYTYDWNKVTDEDTLKKRPKVEIDPEEGQAPEIVGK